MRVVRTVSGIVLITISVLCFVIGGALWVVMRHEGSGGAFGGDATGLSTPGNAIVMPDADALIRARAPFTGGSSTTVRVDAQILGGTAFIGLAPAEAVRTYLGPAPYARVAALHVGAGGAVVALQNVPGVGPARPMSVPGGAPGAQAFWAARSDHGQLEWSATDRRYAGMSLVIMRADAAGAVTATAQVEVRPGWMNPTTWALFSLGTIVGLVAIALLMWPPRRREIVYVVEHAQLPEIAERLGVPLRPALTSAIAGGDAVAGGESARPGGVPISPTSPISSLPSVLMPSVSVPRSSVPLSMRGDGFTAAVAGLTIGQVTALRAATTATAAETAAAGAEVGDAADVESGAEVQDAAEVESEVEDAADVEQTAAVEGAADVPLAPGDAAADAVARATADAVARATADAVARATAVAVACKAEDAAEGATAGPTVSVAAVAAAEVPTQAKVVAEANAARGAKAVPAAARGAKASPAEAAKTATQPVATGKAGTHPATTPNWAGPTGGRAEVPPMFTDPKTRPGSLREAVLLNPVTPTIPARAVTLASATPPPVTSADSTSAASASVPASASASGSVPAPTRTNERGIYRSFGSAPPVTPAFVWAPTEPETAPID